MQTINPNCADPSISNSYKVYEDVIGGGGTYGSGNGTRYTIQTNIRARLYVDARVIRYDTNPPYSVRGLYEALWNRTINDDGTITVFIDVPDGCYVYYRIVGFVNFENLLPPRDYNDDESVGISPLVLDNLHNHDGVNSPQINYGNITGIPPVPTLRQTIQWTSPLGAYGYIEPYSQEGIVIGFKGVSVAAFVTYDTGSNIYNRASISYTTLNVVPGDRISLRWWDDGGTDRLSIYKNNSLQGDIGIDILVGGITNIVLMFTEQDSSACVPSATDTFAFAVPQDPANPIVIQFYSTYTSLSSHAEVSTDINFGGYDWEGNGTTTTAIIPGGTLSSATTYYYRVYMVNANGNSEYSEIRSFTTI